jgi:hypothetical protein
MPKRSNEFQHIVTLIERLLSDRNVQVIESKELQDKITNDAREVDIVIERKEGVHKIIVSVECTGGTSPCHC